LINAYRSAAANAIDNCTIETRDIVTDYRIECPYPLMNQLYQIIRSEGYLNVRTSMEEKCIFDISVIKSETHKLETLLGNIYGVSFRKLVVDK
jgi:putative IMPACT (imprinted ancient) family translation regulator